MAASIPIEVQQLCPAGLVCVCVVQIVFLVVYHEPWGSGPEMRVQDGSLFLVRDIFRNDFEKQKQMSGR